MRLFLLLIVFCIVSPVSANDDLAALDQLSEDWRSAYEAGDIEALRDLYEPDVWLMTRDQPAKKGREAVLAYFAAIKASGNKGDIKFDYEERTIDGNYAFNIAKWWLVVSGPGGEEVFRDSGRSFLVFKRGDDDRWRIWRDMDNHTPDVVFSAEDADTEQ